ncbi:MAG TPA: hypothetical protein VFU15_08060, partial [Bacteroidia bacterium]|nr:hypothetical protein [Bacteroidia bacterium]
MRHLFVFLLLCGQLPAQVLSKEETLNNHIRSRTQTIAYPSLLKSSVVKDIYDTAARLIEEDRISLSDERKTDETRTLFSFCDDGSLGYTLTYRNDTLTDSTVIAHAFPAYETRSYLHGRLYACEQWSGDSLHRKIVRMTLSSNDTFRDVREIFNTYGPGGKRMERNVIEVYSWYGRTDTISDEKTRYFGDLHTRITDRFDNSGYGNYEWSRDSIRKTETFVFFSAKGKITGKNVICFSDSGKVLRDTWLDKKG